MTKLNLPITKLDERAELPKYAYQGDAGLDLRALESITLKPLERAIIHTGLAIAIPEHYAGYVQPRSGMALKRGLSIPNTPGLIDSHYRGELMVACINLNKDEDLTVEAGERIAQLVILPIPEVTLVEVEKLDETDRGAGGFGSSGTH